MPAPDDRTANNAPQARPEPPEAPLPSDCCGTGCTPCIMDIYADARSRWQAEIAALEAVSAALKQAE